MPNVRRLGFRDRFVWSLIQTVTGGSSSLPPVQFEPGIEKSLTVSFTQETWNEVFSALLTGADLTYPEKAHEVVWNLLKHVEYPMSALPPAGFDSNFTLHTRFAGNNGFTVALGDWGAHPFAYAYGAVTPEIGQLYDWNGFFTPGQWVCQPVYIGTTGSAICEVSWRIPDGDITVIGSFDMYRTFTQVNQMSTLMFEIDYPYRVVVRAKALGKHASSSGYQMNLTCLNFARYGD